jgi:hypothetical protein
MLIIDNQTGNLNFGGQDCERAATIEARKRKEEEARKARADEKFKAKLKAAKTAGFITISESPVNWNDAKAFCQKAGGRLPRVNNSDSMSWPKKDQIYSIDGFGATGRPWLEVGLPYGSYWTATSVRENPDAMMIVWGQNHDPKVNVHYKYNATKSSDTQGVEVVCVP